MVYIRLQIMSCYVLQPSVTTALFLLYSGANHPSPGYVFYDVDGPPDYYQ